MEQESHITRSDMAKRSIIVTITKVAKIRWTVENVSKISDDSPDIKGFYVNIRNKSYPKIKIERTIVFYDCNDKKLYEERDAAISLVKNRNECLTSYIIGEKFRNLANDVLIIDLCISIKEDATQKLNGLICDIDPERKLKEDFKTMLENPVNSDISLQVGDERIPAHWSVLCTRSPYFKRMFDSGMQESVQNSVTIADSSLGTVKKLIHFLYTADFIQEDDLQELFDLYYAADKYEVMDLRALCGGKIISNATINNVCEILQLCHRHNDKALKKETMNFIRSHSDAVFETEGWKKFEVSEPVIAEFLSYCLTKS